MTDVQLNTIPNIDREFINIINNIDTDNIFGNIYNTIYKDYDKFIDTVKNFTCEYFDHTKHTHNSVCPICLSPFNEGDSIYVTKCGHCFCNSEECGSIPEWSRAHNTCPVCRQNL